MAIIFVIPFGLVISLTFIKNYSCLTQMSPDIGLLTELNVEAGTWANIFYGRSVVKEGTITAWWIVARDTVGFHTAIWRPQAGGFILVNKAIIVPRRIGLQKIELPYTSYQPHNPGDVIGVHPISSSDAIPLYYEDPRYPMTYASCSFESTDLPDAGNLDLPNSALVDGCLITPGFLQNSLFPRMVSLLPVYTIDSITTRQHTLHGTDSRYTVTELVAAHHVRHRLECAQECLLHDVCNSYHISVTSPEGVTCQLTWYYHMCHNVLQGVSEIDTKFYSLHL